MTKLNKLIIPVLALSGLFLFLLLTSPKNLPLSALLIPFGLAAVVTFHVFHVLFIKVMGYKSRTGLVAALLLTLEVTLLLLLSSLDQLKLSDFVIMVIFGGLFLWYSSKFYNR